MPHVALYVDDHLLIGDAEAINEAIKALKENSLVLKIVEGLQDYLFCKVTFSTDKRRVPLGQPHLFKNLAKS